MSVFNTSEYPFVDTGSANRRRRRELSDASEARLDIITEVKWCQIEKERKEVNLLYD